jgi:hypothetical protein
VGIGFGIYFYLFFMGLGLWYARLLCEPTQNLARQLKILRAKQSYETTTDGLSFEFAECYRAHSRKHMLCLVLTLGKNTLCRVSNLGTR